MGTAVARHRAGPSPRDTVILCPAHGSPVCDAAGVTLEGCLWAVE